MLEKKLNWYAVYTKPRWEKKVARLLEDKCIENYCPLNKVTKQWKDRKKVILEPVFKSYVFVRVSDELKWELKKINGIVNFVYWLRKPAVIKDEEIEIIKRFLSDFKEIEVEEIKTLKLNSKVRVRHGVLMDYQGILIEIKGSKARVKLESMGIQISAQFDKKNLEILPEYLT